MTNAAGEPLVLVEDIADGVRRITLNRPEKRNALNTRRCGARSFAALRQADLDDAVRVTIVRGAGVVLLCGLRPHRRSPRASGCRSSPSAGEGHWPRHVTEGWMSIWDLAKPVIAQVHGYCLAGGSELATGCDLVYVADDAKIGYPAVRFGTPDMQFHAWFMGMRTAMEMMITGDSISGTEAARLGWANKAYPIAELDEHVLAVAERIAKVPPDIVQLNKRTVHRAMDVMGLRAAIRSGTELCSLAIHQEGFKEFLANMRNRGLTSALSSRDEPFGDYRTTEPHPGEATS